MRMALPEILGLSFAIVFCCSSHAQPTAPLALLKTIPLAGYTGSFDHFAFDAVRRRFLLAAEDHGTIEVFDMQTGAHINTISGFDKPHNIVVRPGGRQFSWRIAALQSRSC